MFVLFKDADVEELVVLTTRKHRQTLVFSDTVGGFIKKLINTFCINRDTWNYDVTFRPSLCWRGRPGIRRRRRWLLRRRNTTGGRWSTLSRRYRWRRRTRWRSWRCCGRRAWRRWRFWGGGSHWWSGSYGCRPWIEKVINCLRRSLFTDNTRW